MRFFQANLREISVRLAGIEPLYGSEIIPFEKLEEKKGSVLAN